MRRTRRTALVGVLALVAACNGGGSTSPTTSVGTGGDPTIECRDVPEELCQSYVSEAIAGPQPSGAGEIVSVTVTCEMNPPCTPERLESGGEIVVTYDDGRTWTQEWAVGSGT